MGLASAMVAKAASQVGVREGYDSVNGWNNVQPYGKWYADKIGNQAFRAVAWCDIFISWCAYMSGNGDIIPMSAWVPGRLAYYRRLKRTGMSFPPKPGDIGIVIHNGSAVHVFLVEKWIGDDSSGYVQTLEGNTNDTGSYQGNGVYRLKRKDWDSNTGIIYCRPAYSEKAVPATGGGASAPLPSKPAPKPPAPPAPPALPSIPAPPKWFRTNELLNDENLRLHHRSNTARIFNPKLWSWLYWQGGSDGRAYCQRHYSAWMKESASEFGDQALAAVQEAYRILNKRDRAHWPDKETISPKPTWPGAALLKVLGFRAD